MAENKTMRLNKVLRELNISLDRAVEHLASNGIEIEARPTTKISESEYGVLLEGFQTDKSKKAESQEVGEEKRKEKEAIAQERLEKKRIEDEAKKQKEQEVLKAKADAAVEIKTVGKIDLDGKKDEKPTDEVTEQTTTESNDKPNVAEAAKEEVVEVVEEKIEEKVVAQEPKTVEIADKSQEVEIPQEKKVVEVEDKKETEPKASDKQAKSDTPAEPQKIRTQYQKLDGPKLAGTIDLKQFERPKKKKVENNNDKGGNNNASAGDRKKRKRIVKKSPMPQGGGQGNHQGGGKRGNFKKGGQGKKPIVKEEPTEAEVQKQVRETLERLQGKSKKSKGAKYRREKRDSHREQSELNQELAAAESKVLKITEFVTVSEIATMMNIPVTQIIGACMSLGMMVTMNQRLDAETLSIVAEEFGYKVEFISADVEEAIPVEEDEDDDLVSRAPIVTVMGHVDHGKTSLLDYIRKANVIAGESGGITQHIGAYGVALEDGQRIAFLDTPGHEAFTAMRARGAQVTDIVIIVVAADDGLMPQTKEAISHAQAAGVPIIFAINKIDVQGANPDKIKEQLAAMDLLVEDWGGKIQSHDISAKKGIGIDELLEKVLLEAEMLDLKANPDKRAIGTVVEAYLDKGRGFVSTMLVQEGTLKIGDFMLAGQHSGKVKAMFDERGNNLQEAGPSTPVSILGLDGAPQAGDKFYIFEDEREAKQIANKRSQLQREQSVRTQKHITLDEIGRRIALGDFQELNIILKGDVDGSVEALTDSFQKLSTDEIQVNIIHKGVGAITESDVLLASASDAIVIGFNVRPVGNARVTAEQEEIDIRTYSIIYDAINDLKDAMEGMLSPEIKEEVTGNVEIREVYKISKVGNVAGCMVISGKIKRSSFVRIIRDGVVVHTGELEALKRFKDDVKEVTKGYDCGVQVKGFNDIKVGDVLEAYEEVSVKKTL